MPPTIRPALLDDEPAVLALIEELFAAPGRRPPGYTPARGAVAFQHAVHSPTADVLLAVDDGEIVGLASVYVDLLSIRFGARCWLEDLVVTSARRSTGVGRALLAAAVAWGRHQGCTHLQLNSAVTRTDAHRFYRANAMAQDSFNFQLTL